MICTTAAGMDMATHITYDLRQVPHHTYADLDHYFSAQRRIMHVLEGTGSWNPRSQLAPSHAHLLEWTALRIWPGARFETLGNKQELSLRPP